MLTIVRYTVHTGFVQGLGALLTHAVVKREQTADFRIIPSKNLFKPPTKDGLNSICAPCTSLATLQFCHI